MNREDFPMINEKLIYLDNGATTFKPQVVIDSIVEYYSKHCANAHRGDYSISQTVNTMYEDVREKICKFINADDTSEIVFTSGTTDGLNKIIFGYFSNHLVKDDEVLITESEHASNVLPWFILQEKIGIKVKYIPLNENHEVTIDNVKSSITSKTKVISLAYITNVIGDIRPMREIIDYAHKHNILVVGDGAQSISHLKTNVTLDDIDFFVASAHKMYGPTGVGFLYGKYDLLNEMKATTYGGGMNAMYLRDGYMELKGLPDKFEAGTQNIAGVIGMGKAIDYLESIGINKIMKHEHKLKEYLIDKLKKLDDIIIYNENTTGSIVTFNVEGVFAQDTSVYLNEYNICIRSGNHCSKILNEVFNVNNTCRVSFGIYNTYEEIDKLVEVLSNVSEIWKIIL